MPIQVPTRKNSARYYRTAGRNHDERDALTHVYRFVDYDSEAPERDVYERRWFIDTMYYAGNQHSVMDHDGRFRSPRLNYKNYEPYEANLILPNVSRAVNKIASQNFSMDVAPKSSAFEDRHAAKLSMRVLDHLRYVTDFDRKSRLALTMAAIQGSGFMKYSWDPKAGNPVRIYKRPGEEPRIDLLPEEQEVWDRQGWYVDTYPGEVLAEPVSIFNIWWPWDAREGGIDDCERLAYVYVDLRDTLEKRFEVDLADAETYAATHGAQRYLEAIAYINRSTLGTMKGPRPAHADGERILVIEMWERPSPGWPKGRRILVAGNKVLKDGDNPYDQAGVHIPFSMVNWNTLPGRFPGVSLVSHLRGPQRARNRSRAVALSIEKTHGYPITMLPSGAPVEVDRDLHSVPGVVLRVGNFNQRPVVSQPPHLPPYIGENADRAQAEIHSISGQQAGSDSNLPGQVRSGLGIQAVQEDSNMILSEPAFNFAHFVKDCGQVELALAGHFYDDARVLQVAGPSGRIEVETFTGADLRGHTQVLVFGQPGRIESSTAYQSKILEMVELGILNPNDPRDKIGMLKAMESRIADEIAEDKLRDEERFETIARRLIKNPMFYRYQMQPWDDPSAAARVLERHLKSDDFEEYTQETQQALALLWQQASQALEKQIAMQMQLATMQRGQPGQKGQASQPRRTG
jgi:hypothetical protein